MVQYYTDWVIVVLFTLWLFSQLIVAGTVAKASEVPGKGSTATISPDASARYFSWWKWSSVMVEIASTGMIAAMGIHLIVCTTADFHFFNNHFFINGSM